MGDFGLSPAPAERHSEEGHQCVSTRNTDYENAANAPFPLLYPVSLANKSAHKSSTSAASISQAPARTYLPAPAYKISKAALNALTVQYAIEYEKEGFSFIALCPGVRIFLVSGPPPPPRTSSLQIYLHHNRYRSI